MQVPLELYAEAFQLQSHGNLKAAEKICRQIIEEFPNTREREYSEILLEKIRLDSGKKEIKDRPVVQKRGIRPIGIISFILSIAACLFIVVLLLLFLRQQSKIKLYGELLKAVVAYSTDNESAFYKYVTHAKKISPKDKAPYLLTADFYLKRKDFDAAKKMLKSCPVFDTEVRLYYDRINKLKKELKENP